MIFSRSFRRAILITTALFSTACLGTARPRAGVVYVSSGPPRARVEVVAVSPSRAHVWIPGYYAWRGREYVWIPGRYDVPPRGLRRWEPGKWRHDRGGWYFVEGRWR